MTNPTCKSGLSPFKRQDTLLRGLLFCPDNEELEMKYFKKEK